MFRYRHAVYYANASQHDSIVESIKILEANNPGKKVKTGKDKIELFSMFHLLIFFRNCPIYHQKYARRNLFFVSLSFSLSIRYTLRMHEHVIAALELPNSTDALRESPMGTYLIVVTFANFV
jgi:hypothetical protein